MEENKKKFKKAVLLIFPLLIAFYIISMLFIKEIWYYTTSKSILRYIVYFVCGIDVLINLIFTFKGFKLIKINKTKKYIPYLIFLIIFILGELFVTVNINKISNSLSRITSKQAGYSSSLVVLKSSNLKNINDVKKKDIKIGMVSIENNKESYILPMEIIKEEKIDNDNIKYYEDFGTMINDLYDSKIDAMFISSSYVSMFASEEGFEDIGDKTKIIYEKTKKEAKQRKTSGKTFKEPFSILIMGVDSEADKLEKSNSFNGDTLMLITFNPNTLNTTILSIPRDTRVPIVCTKNKAKNKINSSAYYGADCVIDTVTNLTGIEIDYWVKVNFRAVVSLVDAMGGVEIDVPYAFCEQDSQRKFGDHTIYIEKGLQTLNGEEALAFARNRHPWPEYCGKKYSNYVSNDFIRGQNQQTIVRALTNKLKSVNTLTEIYDILDIIEDNIDTNIDKDTIITGFDTLKNVVSKSRNIDNEDFIGTQRLYLSGYDNMIDGIYYFEYYNGSLKDISDAMKINLELKEPKLDKEFSFSVNRPYESKQIGKGTYSK